jgi:hypothetical protein
MVSEGNIGFETGGGRVGGAEAIDTKDTDVPSRRLALAEESRKPALSGLALVLSLMFSLVVLPVFRLRMGLEGIVSKRISVPYRSGRSHNWIKTANCSMQRLASTGMINWWCCGKPTCRPMTLTP